MDVYKCVLYGHTPEEVISDDFIKYFEDNVNNCIQNREAFSIKSVLEGQNPTKISNTIIGFHSYYGLPYISHPEKNKGLIGVDCQNKRLTFSRRDEAHYEHRDAFMYRMKTGDVYVKEGYENIIFEFLENGYDIFEFISDKEEDSLVFARDPKSIFSDREISLDELLRIIAEINQ